MSGGIRDVRCTEYKVLDDYLYDAIFIPDGVPAPPKEIVHKRVHRVLEKIMIND